MTTKYYLFVTVLYFFCYFFDTLQNGNPKSKCICRPEGICLVVCHSSWWVLLLRTIVTPSKVEGSIKTDSSTPLRRARNDSSSFYV